MYILFVHPILFQNYIFDATPRDPMRSHATLRGELCAGLNAGKFQWWMQNVYEDVVLVKKNLFYQNVQIFGLGLIYFGRFPQNDVKIHRPKIAKF